MRPKGRAVFTYYDESIVEGWKPPSDKEQHAPKWWLDDDEQEVIGSCCLDHYSDNYKEVLAMAERMEGSITLLPSARDKYVVEFGESAQEALNEPWEMAFLAPGDDFTVEAITQDEKKRLAAVARRIQTILKEQHNANAKVVTVTRENATERFPTGVYWQILG